MESAMKPIPEINPKLDLEFERIIDVPPEMVWRAWTEPELLMPWFCPKPWSVSACEIDLRPGGLFSTTMRSPEGEAHPNAGCYLEVVPNRRLVWTNAVGPGFRPLPAGEGMFAFTGFVLLEPHGKGTRYRAVVVHGNEEDCAKHAAMGFEAGWGKALDQLVEHMRPMM